LGGPCTGIQQGQAPNYGSWVDVYAPGINLLIHRFNDNSGYDTPCASGTSFAAPLVTGTASLLLAAKPGLSPLQVETIIRYTSVATGNQKPDGREVFLLNSDAAFQAALASRLGGSTLFTVFDIPHRRLPDQFPSGIPLEEPGNAVTQNFVAATDDGRFQQSRAFLTTRGRDEAITPYRDFFFAIGWTLLVDHTDPVHLLRVIAVAPPGGVSAEAFTIMQVQWNENTITHNRQINIDFSSNRIH
jgi:hypothetical protein